MSYKYKLAIPLIYTLDYLGLIKAYSTLNRRLRAARIPIITYHRIGDAHLPWQIEPISAGNFKKQIEYLKNHYKILSLNAIIACLKEGRSLPRNGAAITFDGYYKDNYLNAYPILKQYQIPATLFLVTGSMDTREMLWEDKLRYSIWHSSRKTLDIKNLGIYFLDSDINRLNVIRNILVKLSKMPLAQKEEGIQNCFDATGIQIEPKEGKDSILTWNEVREMNENGIEIGSHTVNHFILSKIPPDMAEWEIAESKRRIEAELNKKISFFAFPNGGPEDYTPEIINILKKNGFTGSLINSPPGLVTNTTDLFKLDRINASANTIFFKFSLEILSDFRIVSKKLKRNVDSSL